MKLRPNIWAAQEPQISGANGSRAAFKLLRTGARLLLLACVCATYVNGQAVMEYGHMAAVVSASASAVSSVTKKLSALPTKQPHPLSIPAVGSSVTAEEANRDAFEASAGKHAAKLMLRSDPTAARARVDRKPVGRTPLLLVVAPGVHVVELSGGTRSDYKRQRIDLLPSETREVVLRLAPRYPAQLRISWTSH